VRVKSDDERGPFAAWLRRERVDVKKWKEADTKRRLEAAAEAGVSFSSYRDIEAGNRPPTPAQRRAIVKVFGEVPAFVAAPADQAAIVQAIDRQTAMLKAVLDAILVRLPPAGPKEEDPPQRQESTALDQFVPEVTQQALRALPDVERLAVQPPKRNSPSPQKRGPGGPGAGKRPRSRPDAPRG
jgi:hypothetical protein